MPDADRKTRSDWGSSGSTSVRLDRLIDHLTSASHVKSDRWLHPPLSILQPSIASSSLGRQIFDQKDKEKQQLMSYFRLIHRLVVLQVWFIFTMANSDHSWLAIIASILFAFCHDVVRFLTPTLRTFCKLCSTCCLASAFPRFKTSSQLAMPRIAAAHSFTKPSSACPR